MKSYRQHVRSDATKWFVTTIAILLIGVILTGIMTEGFTDFNPYCWFGHEYGEDGICIKCGAEKPAEDPDNEDQLTGDGSLLSSWQLSSGIANGVRLYATAPVVQENNVITQTLTAHIEPADADNQRVTWSVAWQNPASEFATGKTVTDYVTVTPESDGSLTATVSCLQDFGEQVVVTVASEENAEIQATVICDYLRRIVSHNFVVNDLVFSSSGSEISGGFVFSNYTIEASPSIVPFATLSLTDDFKTTIKAYFDSLNCGFTSSDWNFTDAEISASGNISFSETDFASNFCTFGSLGTEEIVTVKENINKAFRSCLKSFTQTQAQLIINAQMKYDNKYYNSFTATVDCKFDYESLKVDVSDVTLPDGNIIF